LIGVAFAAMSEKMNKNANVTFFMLEIFFTMIQYKKEKLL